MDNRLIELAIEALEARKSAIDKEIERIRKEMRGRPQAAKAEAPTAVPGIRRRRPKTAAEKKALSERMKAYWAERRTEGGKK